MPVLDVFNIEKEKVAQIELSDDIFGADVNEAAVYQVVRSMMAGRRSGTASTKERSDVRGGGKKPWRQKGTGRARAGTIRSPLWRKGGTIFGPRPRDFALKVNKKVKRLALISALSMKVKQDGLVILEDFPLAEIKTKVFKSVMDRFGWGKTLFVIEGEQRMLELSCRNINGVKMIRSEALNVYDLLDYEQVVFFPPSVKKVERTLIA